jgi:hypothetical protein
VELFLLHAPMISSFGRLAFLASDEALIGSQTG